MEKYSRMHGDGHERETNVHLICELDYDQASIVI